MTSLPSYIGWIPNVSGRLSFSYNGLSGGHSRVVLSSNSQSGGRWFLGFQKRQLSDTTLPIPQWLIRKFDTKILGRDGTFYFVYLLKVTEDKERIKGRLLICRSADFKRYRKNLKEKFRDIVENYDETAQIRNEIENLISASIQSGFKVEVQRNGKVLIEMVENYIFAAPFETDARSQKIISSQAYFALKDLFHTHKFHPPSMDTFLDIYELDDQAWVKHAVQSLIRRVVSLRRSEQLKQLQMAKGVLSYAEALIKIHPTAGDGFNFETLAKSLDAAAAYQKTKGKMNFADHWTRSVNAFVFLVPIFLAWFPLLDDDKRQQNAGLNWIYEIFSSNLIAGFLLLWFLQMFANLPIRAPNKTIRTVVLVVSYILLPINRHLVIFLATFVGFISLLTVFLLLRFVL